MDYMQSNGPKIRSKLFKISDVSSLQFDEPIPMEDMQSNCHSEIQKDHSFYDDDKTTFNYQLNGQTQNDVLKVETLQNYSANNSKNIFFDASSKALKVDASSDSSLTKIKRQLEQSQDLRLMQNRQDNLIKNIIQNENQEFQESSQLEQRQIDGSLMIQPNSKSNLSSNIFGQVRISQIVKRFIKSLLNNLEVNKFSQLTNDQFQIINDLSFSYQTKSISGQKISNAQVIYFIFISFLWLIVYLKINNIKNN